MRETAAMSVADAGGFADERVIGIIGLGDGALSAEAAFERGAGPLVPREVGFATRQRKCSAGQQHRG